MKYAHAALKKQNRHPSRLLLVQHLFRKNADRLFPHPFFLTENDSGIERIGYVYLVSERSGQRVECPGRWSVNVEKRNFRKS